MKLEPFSSLDCIKNGMSVTDIAMLFPYHKIFVKNKFSVFPTSKIETHNMSVHYNENGIITGIEVYKENILLVENTNLFGTFEQVVGNLKKAGFEVSNLDTGVEIPSIGISIYCENADQEGAEIDAVYVDFIATQPVH